MGQAAAPTNQPTLNGPHLYGERVTLPLAVVKGYPFLEGSINGKSGKLLFDIGDARAFDIDNHTVTQAGGIAVGKGAFGSGQTFDVIRYPIVDQLKLGDGLHFEKMTNIRGNPGLPLEQHITPDFIGWIGVDFWEGYVFKLDYAKPAVTFYRNDAAGNGERSAEAGETVLQTVAFTNEKLKSIPLVPVKVGGQSMTATLDTGAHCTAWLSDEEIATLTKAGALRVDGDGYIVSGITLNGTPIEPMHIEVRHGRPSFAKFLPEPDAPLLLFGYEFLSSYKTVWNYGNTTLTLLKQ